MPGEKKHRVGTTSSMQLFAVLYGCIQVFSLQNWIDSFIEFSRLKIRQKANNSQRCIKLQPRFNIILYTFALILASHVALLLVHSHLISFHRPSSPQMNQCFHRISPWKQIRHTQIHNLKHFLTQNFQIHQQGFLPTRYINNILK